MKQQIAEAPMTMTHTSNIEVTNDEILDRYKRMQALLQGTRGNGQLVQNVKLYPVWIGDSDHFWYDKMLKTGKEYRLVDARELTNTSAFNHKALAQVLTEAIGEEVNHSDLPITVENIELSPRVVSFTAFGGDWQYNDNTGRLEKHEPVEASAWQTSPDGKHAVFSRDHNIWLRDIESGTERSLTHDGEALFEYVNAGSLQARWSPDSS